MKKLLLVTLLSLSFSVTVHASHSIHCDFNSFTAEHSNEYKNVTSRHDTFIYNTSKQAKGYVVTYQILLNNKLIKNEIHEYVISPNQAVNHHWTVTMPKRFPEKQNYNAVCKTIINGGGEDAQVSRPGEIIIT